MEPILQHREARSTHHKKAECPECHREFYDVARHLRQVHKYSKKSAYARTIHAIGGRKTVTPKRKKVCIVPQCGTYTTNLSKHMKVHNTRVKAFRTELARIREENRRLQEMSDTEFSDVAEEMMQEKTTMVPKRKANDVSKSATSSENVSKTPSASKLTSTTGVSTQKKKEKSAVQQ